MNPEQVALAELREVRIRQTSTESCGKSSACSSTDLPARLAVGDGGLEQAGVEAVPRCRDIIGVLRERRCRGRCHEPQHGEQRRHRRKGGRAQTVALHNCVEQRNFALIE